MFKLKNIAGIKDENDRKILSVNLKIFAALAVIAAVVLLIPSNAYKSADESAETSQFAAVDKICELATLKCYYHDVAEYEKQAEGLFKYRPFKYGYKKVWIEYDGIVEVGIDVNEVQVSEPDRKGVVSIYIPDAKVLNVSANKDTMSEPLIDKGIFTTITAEDKNKAFADAQATMQKNAESDSSMLIQAKNNAKELLGQYIINVGDQMGRKYTVEWRNK